MHPPLVCIPYWIANKGLWRQIMLIDPSQFRVVNDILQKECKGKGKIETMSFAATATAST